ncbi:MAG TPA: type IV secretion system protein [Steroidobacteraceae bacterium]|nr:type IV secretion system protein [Steroidobacteraceae bacterium]
MSTAGGEHVSLTADDRGLESGAAGQGEAAGEVAGEVERESASRGRAQAHAAAGLSAYFQEASAWDRDRIAEWQQSRRRAWRVATAAGVCALAATLALLLLMPLKRVEPFVIRVDDSSGVVDVVPVYAGRMSLPESVTRYFLTHYVQVCERFNYATAESDYEECGAFHTAQRNQAWYAQWNRSNPLSPLNVHRDGSSVSVQIESVSFFKRASGLGDLAQVRYLKIEHASNGAQQQLTHWIATLQYAYATPSQDPSVRRWNPLGFKVVEFISEPEVAHEPQADAAAAPGAVSRTSP